MARYIKLITTGSICLLAVVVCSSCTPINNPNLERGSNYNYDFGHPEIRLAALGLIDAENKGYVDISVDIVRGSLIYLKRDEKFRSELLIQIDLLDSKSQNLLKSVNSKQFIEKRANSYNQVDQRLYSYTKKIYIKPGSYKIRLSVTDLDSQKKSVVTKTVNVPDASEESTSLTSIKMFLKDRDDQWSPVTGYNVSSEVDSIKFYAQAINIKPNDIINVKTELIRFKADTSIAEPMHVNYVPFERQEGINYSNKKVIQSTKRSLSDARTVFLVFKFGSIGKGNYRFKIFESDKEIFKGRDFAIKSANYPTVKTPEEYARPLAYIMSEGKYRDLIAIQNSDSLKKAVDRFWLKNIGSVSKTKEVIRLYYSRVEEANKMFSNFKEGWKTDRGMIYILFGPPWNKKSDLRNDDIQWSYSNDHYASPLNFVFSEARDQTAFFPFENYILKRNDSYFNLQYQQIELWKSGLILSSRIGI